MKQVDPSTHTCQRIDRPIIRTSRTFVPLFVLLVSIFSVQCKKDIEIVTPSEPPLSGRIIFHSIDTDPRNPNYNAIQSIDLKNPDAPVTQLLAGNHAFRVSSNGRSIAYIEHPSGYPYVGLYAIHIMGIDGTQDFTLKQLMCFQLYSLDWSPNSDQIVFDYYLSTTGAWALCTINRDGSGFEPITDTSSNSAYAIAPRWSPVSHGIAFISNSHPLLPDSLTIVSSDGTGRRIIAMSSRSIPTWSLDGQRICFSSRNIYYDKLCIANLNSGVITKIIPPANQVLFSFSLLWLPDNRLLCVGMNTIDSTFSINVVDANNNVAAHEIASGFLSSEPYYSSPSVMCSGDGRLVYVLGRRSGDGFSLFVMQRDGSGLRKVKHLNDSPTSSAIPGMCQWVQ